MIVISVWNTVIPARDRFWLGKAAKAVAFVRSDAIQKPCHASGRVFAFPKAKTREKPCLSARNVIFFPSNSAF